jgi:hypothetical protein
MNAPILPATLRASSAQLPATYEHARTALANCAQIDECKEWADKAAALASYAKQAEDLELERMAARIRARAMRRAGELLKQIEPGQGARDGKRADGGDNPLTRSEAARDAGMSERQQVTAVRIASIPEPDFSRQVESPNPPTLTTLAQQGTQKREAPTPETWLKGRDPAAFNKALHFVAGLREYAAELSRADLAVILPALIEAQAAEVRKLIGQIDSIHDTIVTRI